MSKLSIYLTIGIAFSMMNYFLFKEEVSKAASGLEEENQDIAEKLILIGLIFLWPLPFIGHVYQLITGAKDE